jgi:O-antigen ligase
MNLYGLINVFFPTIGFCFLVVNRADIFQYRMARPIIFFFTMLLISVAFSPDKLISLRQMARYAMHAMVYFIVLASFKDAKDIRTIYRLAVISSLIPLIAGFWQLIQHDSSYLLPRGIGLIRIYATFYHPSAYAMFLVILSLFTMFLANEASQRSRWLYYILFMLLVISLFFTFTRVGWISLFTALSIMGALKYRKAYLLLMSVGVCMLLALPQVSGKIINRLTVVQNDSIWGRFKLNDLSWRLFQEKPIFGQGIGSYKLLSIKLFYGTGTQYGHKTGLAPHNDYMRFLSETGIFGLLAYLILMYYALRISVEFYKQSDDQIRRYGVFLISLILAFLVFGITDQAFEYGGFYFWLFLAIGELIRKNMNADKIISAGFQLKR